MISGAEALIAPGRINPIYLEGKLLPLQASTAAELGLKDGQVVQASVKLQNEQPMLILQGRSLPAPGIQASQVGESIWLRVQNGALVPISSQPVVPRIATLLYRPDVSTELSQLFQKGTQTYFSVPVNRQICKLRGEAFHCSLHHWTPRPCQYRVVAVVSKRNPRLFAQYCSAARFASPVARLAIVHGTTDTDGIKASNDGGNGG